MNLDNKEISALDKILVDELFTFEIKNLSYNCPSLTSATLFSLNCLVAYVLCNLNTILQFRTILFKGIIQSA